jgi:hypothetical protein
MEKIAPGIYIDDDQEMHIDVPELLAAHGFPDTPANRQAVVRAAVKVFQDAGTRVEVTPHALPFPQQRKES